MKNVILLTSIAISTLLFSSCKDDEDKDNMTMDTVTVNDPEKATEVSVDRFSSKAGMLMVRDDMNGLPGANVAIDFDAGEPFITKGLGPNGEKVQYYNFDIQPTAPAPIYVLFKSGSTMPVDGQLNIINVIPGDNGYNDFWQVVKVTVPSDYTANEVSSYDEIMNKGYAMETTTKIVNCPVVPKGSSATMRLNGEATSLTKGWYKKQLVYYFNFLEKDLEAQSGKVPVSPIYVTFNENPPTGGPSSGFVTEMGTSQTHNVVATLPSDANYSPLWSVNPYDNKDFNMVKDLMTAKAANIIAMGVANVNCPIVKIEQ